MSKEEKRLVGYFTLDTDKGPIVVKATDIEFIEGQDLLQQKGFPNITSVSKVTFEAEAVPQPEAREQPIELTLDIEALRRAHELRTRYRESFPDPTSIPLSKFVTDVVDGPLDFGPLHTIDRFLGMYGTFSVNAHRNFVLEGWRYKNRTLAERIGRFLVEEEEKAIEGLNFTDVEKMPISKLDLSPHPRGVISKLGHSFWRDNEDYSRVAQFEYSSTFIFRLPPITNLGTLSMRGPAELPRAGPVSISELRERLGRFGLSLATAA